MSDTYTPTTDEVRYWVAGRDPHAGAEFDRMIESVRAEERERIARELSDEAVVIDEFGNLGLYVENAEKIAREGA